MTYAYQRANHNADPLTLDLDSKNLEKDLKDFNSEYIYDEANPPESVALKSSATQIDPSEMIDYRSSPYCVQVQSIGRSKDMMIPVTVECSVQPGAACLQVLSQMGPSLEGAKERCRIALETIGIKLPAKKISISVSPTEHRIDGSHLDVSVAVALALALKRDFDANEERFQKAMFFGELSLNGDIHLTPDVLSSVFRAMTLDVTTIIVPVLESKTRRHILDLLKWWPNPPCFIELSNIHEVIDWVFDASGLEISALARIDTDQNEAPRRPISETFDEMHLSDEQCLLAMSVALGRHSLLMMGPPGCGKTMFAQRLKSLMPSIESRFIKDQLAMGRRFDHLEADMLISGETPFRSPHHTSSSAAILGSQWDAGEMTRSHGGILFFDELTEFRRDVLESLREPLETGSVHVSRSGFKASYPAEFIFVAAANPCHCGWFGSRDSLCKCHTSRVKAYQSRLSGPLLERIDLLTWFEKPKDHHLASTLARVSSKDLLEKLHLALDFRKDRLNRRISEHDAKEVELLGLCKKYKMQQVSFRSQKKLLSVARTLADLRLSETVQSEDLDQAFRWSSSYFRSRVLTL